MCLLTCLLRPCLRYQQERGCFLGGSSDHDYFIGRCLHDGRHVSARYTPSPPRGAGLTKAGAQASNSSAASSDGNASMRPHSTLQGKTADESRSSSSSDASKSSRSGDNDSGSSTKNTVRLGEKEALFSAACRKKKSQSNPGAHSCENILFVPAPPLSGICLCCICRLQGGSHLVKKSEYILTMLEGPDMGETIISGSVISYLGTCVLICK